MIIKSRRRREVNVRICVVCVCLCMAGSVAVKCVRAHSPEQENKPQTIDGYTPVHGARRATRHTRLAALVAMVVVPLPGWQRLYCPRNSARCGNLAVLCV